MERGERIVDDLTELVELTEPSLLNALSSRFQQRQIYTNSGTILLAINPFCRLDQLYGNELLDSYKKPNRIPHIYGIASNAYHALQLNCVNQSILISGESGSGKTESTKLLMEYLVHVGNTKNESTRRSIHLTKQVLDANVVLESFGNARTLRNDNSSRFGKFIQLQFQQGELLGASIQTYLLEKVRLVNPSLHERNYHVFYEVCMGASTEELESWRILRPNQTRQDALASFRYLSASQCYDRRDRIDDRDTYAKLVKSLSALGLMKDDLFRVLSAILHLGNIKFDGEPVAPKDEASWNAMAAAAVLLSVPVQELQSSLCTRTLFVAHEVKVLALSVAEATCARDGLAKALYARLFDWLVERMNETLAPSSSHSNWIGILDIFGFEVFQVNSFEQLCINFTNEILQMKFNAHVFKLEQLEYVSQGITWNLVDFEDNKDCVDLIIAKPCGLFALLDEESLLATGSDRAFASKLYRECLHHRRLAASKVQQGNGRFVVHHYAGSVEYTTTGFRAKNISALAQDVISLLQEATSPFTRQLAEGGLSRPSSIMGTKSKRNVSVASQFKGQLTELIDLLQDTTPHYVRCLKPNDKAVPFFMNNDRITEQLRSNGVLQAIQITRSGYPIRLPTSAFHARYAPLVHGGEDYLEKLVSALPVLNTAVDDAFIAVGLQVGKTKVFLQAKTHGELERRRSEMEREKLDVIKRIVTGYHWRRRYLLLRATTIWCQRTFRARQQRVDAATKIQSNIRRWLAQKYYKKYLLACRAVVILQRRFRSKRWNSWCCYQCRRIQALVRMFLVRKHYQTLRRGAKILQRWTRIYVLSTNTAPQTSQDWASEDSCASFEQEMELTYDPVIQTSPTATRLTLKPLNVLREGLAPYRTQGELLPKLKLVDVSTLAPLAEHFSCSSCIKRFTLFRRKYYCQSCGHVICGSCSISVDVNRQKARVCLVCSALHTTSESLTSSDDVSSPWRQPWPEPPVPLNELKRLGVVRKLNIEALRQNPGIQKMCTVIFHSWPCSVALISIMCQTQQVILAKVGSQFPDELARDISFCAHTICMESALVVLDASKDVRFRLNPLVKGKRGKFRFYLGSTLVDTQSHQVFGTISIFHTQSRKTSIMEWEQQALANFSQTVSQQISETLQR